MFLLKLMLSKQFSASRKIILLSIVSGAANVALLVVICDALRYISDVNRLVYLAIVFLIASLLLWFTQRTMMHLFTGQFGDAIDLMRSSLLRRTLAANYLKANALGGHHIGVAVSRTFDVILNLPRQSWFVPTARPRFSLECSICLLNCQLRLL